MTHATSTYRRLWTYLRPYWRLELIALVTMVILAALVLALPIAVQYMVDTLIPGLIAAGRPVRLGPVGLFSAFLAPLCDRLIGIEASPAACEDFTINLDEFENVELYEDAAENVLPAIHVQADAIVVDPPRSGLEPAALDGILRLAPRTLVYVSCDPSTLARDARRLIDGGYTLHSSTPFDLFPQTYHIESISWFVK